MQILAYAAWLAASGDPVAQGLSKRVKEILSSKSELSASPVSGAH